MGMHYLDNGATTCPYSEVVKEMARVAVSCFGNPSSQHLLGELANKELENARNTISKHMGCKPSEVVFTASGTESNNLAIFGAVNSLNRKGKRIITTRVEHSSVLAPFEALVKQGFEVKYLSVNKGKIDFTELDELLSEDTIFVSVMAQNNVTGHVMPVGEIAKRVKEKCKNAVFHTDGIAAFGKVKIDLSDIDLMSVSAHKIHGPKGAAALYVKKGVRILPVIYGGGQEKGMRSGTENVPAIAGFAKACELYSGENKEKVFKLKNMLLELLPKYCIVNSPNYSDYIINISLPSLMPEVVMRMLECENVFISSGSACNKNKSDYVLKEMGYSETVYKSSVRITLSPLNNEDDIKALCNGLEKCINKLKGN